MALGWAIVSAGRHVDNRIAPAINAAAGAELAAVYSRDRGRADAFAKKHGAGAAYDSMEAMLRDPRVDAVFVASPNSLHAPQTIQAARAGKHVLAEKPMATTLEDAAAMVRECRDHGVKLGMAFELRQHPGHVLARDLIARGVLGRIGLAHGQWGTGVRGQAAPPPRLGLHQWLADPDMVGGASVMMGLGVHVVDLLRFLLGREVTEVAAITDGQTSRKPLEELVTMLLRFDGGTIATVCCGWLLPDSRNDITLYGVNGRIAGRSTLYSVRRGAVEIASETVNRTEEYPLDELAGFIGLLEDFRGAVEEDREPAATGMDGAKVVQVTLAMIESARTGRRVTLEPLKI